MMELFQEYDVEFVSSTEKFDTSTPMGRAMLNICIVFAQLERETIQKRVTDAYYSRCLKGFHMSGLSCTGTLQDEILTLNDVQGQGVTLYFVKSGSTMQQPLDGDKMTQGITAGSDTDVGIYVLESASDSEYTLSKEELALVDMEDFYIELRADGTGETYMEDFVTFQWKDGYAVYGQEAIPVYADDEGTTLKTGTSTDPDYPNDTTVYLCVYEKVRTQAAMATLDYDGNILGIGGGIGEKKYDLGFNRATSPHQTGSTMKPIGAYALALDYKLINYSSQILDSPYYSAEDKKVLKDQYIGVMSPFSEAAQSRSDVWRAWPTNYGGVGGQGNPMLVYDALQQSYNTVAVWVGDMVGVDYLYNFVHDTLECSYVSAENDMDLGPLVLGSQSSGLTVVQLAGAYTMFNTGTFTTPHYYTEITDYQGNMILDNNKYINTTQAISADTAYIMNRMMWNVLHSRKGTAYGKAPDGEMDSVAKTGTTSNYKDYTFAGLTPYYVTAIWWGCDRPTEMDTLGKAGKNASPIQYAWKALMEDLQADLPVKEFAKGENVVEKHFDTSTGAIISSGGSVGYYTEDNLPDNSYTVSEDDPYAALAQAAADAAAAAGDSHPLEPTE